MYFFGSAADPMVLKMISWYSNNGHLSYSETDVGTPIITRVRVPNKEKLCCVWKNLIEYKYVLVLWRRSVHFRSGSQMHMIPPHNSMKITEMFFQYMSLKKLIEILIDNCYFPWYDYQIMDFLTMLLPFQIFKF